MYDMRTKTAGHSKVELSKLVLLNVRIHKYLLIGTVINIETWQWAKKEDIELDTLSEWIKSIGEVVKRRIRRLKHSVNTRYESIFRDPDVVREFSRFHENFVIVPADKASNNYNLNSIHYLETLHTN